MSHEGGKMAGCGNYLAHVQFHDLIHINHQKKVLHTSRKILPTYIFLWDILKGTNHIAPL